MGSRGPWSPSYAPPALSRVSVCRGPGSRAPAFRICPLEPRAPDAELLFPGCPYFSLHWGSHKQTNISLRTDLGSRKGWTQGRAYSLSLSLNLCLSCSRAPSLSISLSISLSSSAPLWLAMPLSFSLSVSESLCASLFVSHGSLCLLNLKISSISCFSASECLGLCVSAFLSPALFSLLPQSLSL